jgi:hypothetical protein
MLPSPSTMVRHAVCSEISLPKGDLTRLSKGGVFEDKVGYGTPTEDAYVHELSFFLTNLILCDDSLFLNVVCPPSFPQEKNFPVRVYVHGGCAQPYASFTTIFI